MRVRGAFVLSAVLALLVVGPAAFADELSDELERAARADFEGVQWVFCRTPDGIVSQVADVVQAGGVVRVGAVTDDRAWFASPGEYRSQSTLVRVEADQTLTLSSRYQVRRVADSVELSRAVRVLQVAEGDIVRLDYRFDQTSGALLRTESFNADGSSYCTTSFFSFSPGAETPVVVAPAETVQMVHEEVDTDSLPASLAGFTRADGYAGSEGTVGAFYSDGLFSFLLVWADREVVIDGIGDENEVELDRGTYQRRFLPGQVVYVWETSDGGYALLGDIPTDVQLAVLDALPQPGKPGFLSRLWRVFRSG